MSLECLCAPPTIKKLSSPKHKGGKWVKKPVLATPAGPLQATRLCWTQTIKVSGVNRIRFVFFVHLELKNDSFRLKMWQIVEPKNREPWLKEINVNRVLQLLETQLPTTPCIKQARSGGRSISKALLAGKQNSMEAKKFNVLKERSCVKNWAIGAFKFTSALWNAAEEWEKWGWGLF